MYKYLALLAYFLVFAAFPPIATELLGTHKLFFSNIPYPYSLYFDWRWYILGASLVFGVLAWLSARKRISDITDYKHYTRGYFSKKQKELIKTGIQGDKKLKHLAMRTEWAPILQPSIHDKGWVTPSGKMTAMLRIKSNKMGVIHLAPSIQSSIFNIYIILVGIGLLSSSFWATESSGSIFWLYAIGIAMVIGGVWLFKFQAQFYFNKNKNEFIKIESSFLKNKNTHNNNKKLLSLDDISALQIIRNNNTDRADTWELNIIRKNAKRYNITFDTRRVILTEIAITLAKFLNVPVWEDIGVHYGVVQEETITLPTWDSILDYLLRKKT